MMGSRKREHIEEEGGDFEGRFNFEEDVGHTMAPERKERVLHTRVPAVLERELKRVAESLRIPVSNLVRTVLEDAIAIADQAGGKVEERLKSVADNIESERGKLRRRVQRDPLEGIIAFQAVKLAQPADCTKCEKTLKRGEAANLGIHEDPRIGAPRVFVCDECLPAD